MMIRTQPREPGLCAVAVFLVHVLSILFASQASAPLSLVKVIQSDEYGMRRVVPGVRLVCPIFATVCLTPIGNLKPVS